MELTNDVKNILGLHLPTDPRWVDLAGISLEDILTDHAWCEQKAATSCISLVQRYSDKGKLVTELAPIVSEEWGHFRLFIELAETYLDKEKVRRRWHQWLVFEATVMKELEIRGDRIH